jgi:hypothetical protein
MSRTCCRGRVYVSVISPLGLTAVRHRRLLLAGLTMEMADEMAVFIYLDP